MKLDIIQDITNGEINIDNFNLIKDKTKNEVFELLSNELGILRNKIIYDSKQYIGTKSIKYREPKLGLKKDFFDCSGFITFILNKYGLSKSTIRHTNEYFDNYGVFIQNPIPGDLVFFSKNGLYPSHIGLFIGNNEYIHAPGKDGTKIKISKLENKFIKGDINKLIYLKNPIGFKRITLDIINDGFIRWNKVI